jgi:hypothetical protein
MPRCGPVLPVRCILQGLCSFGLFLFLIGCSDLKDSDIASRLASDRSTFERMAKMAEANQLSCFEAPSHVLKCDDPDALPLFERLHKREGVRAVHTKMNVPRVSSGVYFAMATYGPITTNSESKGLLYATTKPQPLVADTDEHEDVPRRFNALDGNWYVFATP